MKIKKAFEPPTCTPDQSVFEVIHGFDAQDTHDQIRQCIQKWSPLPFNYMTHLLDWADVLNKFDSVIEEILTRWKGQIILSDDSSTAVAVDSAGGLTLAEDIITLKLVLKFTTSLLKMAVNKEIYNSVEVCAWFNGDIVFSHRSSHRSSHFFSYVFL